MDWYKLQCVLYLLYLSLRASLSGGEQLTGSSVFCLLETVKQP